VADVVSKFIAVLFAIQTETSDMWVIVRRDLHDDWTAMCAYDPMTGFTSTLPSCFTLRTLLEEIALETGI
jgi:hypothetical protein